MGDMWKGENLWTMLMTYSMFPLMMLGMIFSEYLIYVIVGGIIYFAVLFYVRTQIILNKREMIDGVLWLDSWTIRDLDYSEEMLWGVETAKLMDYTLGTKQESQKELINEAKAFLELWDKKDSESEKENKKLTGKDKEIVALAKEKKKTELKGVYFYLVKLSEDTKFSDTEKHLFKKAIFITTYPFWIEFNPSRIDLIVEGYSAKARAAKCALNIEAWLTDTRPLVTVAWTESDTLELKARLQKIQNSKDPYIEKSMNVIRSLRNIIDFYEAKTEQLRLTEDKWRRRAAGFEELYQESEQFWEIVRDDYFDSNYYERKNTLNIGKKWGVAILIVIIILIALVFAFL
ncbi:MAG: hypothetical protein GF353_28570 [Candidatus Lokiarchaeota archaeon]|nr:hypothetical protein [Candidatus Lokiarchaeota archaeon]MBD3353957.1 hypothetical protein [Candidatus Lokiarchaeota archaeon]